MQEILSGLIRYSAWASKKLLDFAAAVPPDVLERAVPNSHGGILATFQHIYYADRVWELRLRRESIPRFEDPAPGPSFADLDRLWFPLLGRMADWAAGADPEAVIPFRFFSGQAHSLRAREIVHHVVNHATYHRGQAAAMMRQCGLTPPSTDLLFYHLEK